MKPAEDFLREIATEDLEGRGCYVVDWSSIKPNLPELYRDGSFAYTGPALDVALQPWLESQGRWIGRGFACVVFRERINNWIDVLGCSVHELAHWISDPRSIENPAESSQALAMLADWCATCDEVSPPWLSHELPFVRAAAVLANRAGQVLEAIRPAVVRFSQRYTGTPETNWMTALGPELDRCGSIRELLKQDAPAKAVRLWEYVTE